MSADGRHARPAAERSGSAQAITITAGHVDDLIAEPVRRLAARLRDRSISDRGGGVGSSPTPWMTGSPTPSPPRCCWRCTSKASGSPGCCGCSPTGSPATCGRAGTSRPRGPSPASPSGCCCSSRPGCRRCWPWCPRFAAPYATPVGQTVMALLLAGTVGCWCGCAASPLGNRATPVPRAPPATAIRRTCLPGRPRASSGEPAADAAAGCGRAHRHRRRRRRGRDQPRARPRWPLCWPRSTSGRLPALGANAVSWWTRLVRRVPGAVPDDAIWRCWGWSRDRFLLTRVTTTLGYAAAGPALATLSGLLDLGLPLAVPAVFTLAGALLGWTGARAVGPRPGRGRPGGAAVRPRCPSCSRPGCCAKAAPGSRPRCPLPARLLADRWAMRRIADELTSPNGPGRCRGRGCAGSASR